jgi:hypothetical protein
MATSPLFGWEEPDDTDLVKDGAAAIRTLGNAIDTSMGDLLGGSTGQVLSKASNANMDFTWVTSDDANAIQNSLVDAKGDLIAASANDTPARLAVGANGETLVADSSASTGLRYQGNFAAGKNAIINGAFNVNQRNFTSNTSSGSYNFDRFLQQNGGASGTLTITPQTFTAGTAPVAGYEARNFVQCVTAAGAATDTFAVFTQKIEDVRTFAGQTVTISFWAKANSGTPKISIELEQYFGTGGSPSATVDNYAGQVTLSTSWTRQSVTFAVPSLSGKTVGTDANSSSINLNLWLSGGSTFNSRTGSIGLQNNTFQIWGVQIEAGSVATAFQTATGTIQGELAACQRYYVRFNASTSGAYAIFAPSGITESNTNAVCYTPLPVELRTYPSAVEYGGSLTLNSTGTAQTVTAVGLQDRTNTKILSVTYTVASGLTAGQYAFVRANNSSTAYLGVSAEV